MQYVLKPCGSAHRLRFSRFPANIDVVQFHEIIQEGIPEKLFKDEAIDAAVEARKEKSVS